MDNSKPVRSSWPLIGLLALLACSDKGPTDPRTEPPPTTALQIRVKSGDGQDGFPGLALNAPFIITVQDAKGAGVQGVQVVWSLRQGGGTFSDTIAVTDTKGEAQTTLQFGDEVGAYEAVATIAGGDSVAFKGTVRADTVPPRLTDFSLSPLAADVSQANATVSVKFAAADAGSGVFQMALTLESPSGQQTARCSVLGTTAAPSVTESCQLTIPRDAEGGAWKVLSVALQDVMRNEAVVSASDLQAAGMPSHLAITSATPDLLPPTLEGMSILNTEIEIDGSDRTVTFELVLSDDQSGVERAQMTVQSAESSHAG